MDNRRDAAAFQVWRRFDWVRADDISAGLAERHLGFDEE